jgi:hypothetical protein
VVEGARLESGYTGNCIEGSNPFLSAKHRKAPKGAFLIDAAGKACFAKRNQLKKRGTQCWLCDALSPPQLGSPSGNPWKRAKLALQSGIN